MARGSAILGGVIDPERYRLTLTLDGQPALHGWWGSEAPARRKFAATVGEYGRDGTHVILVGTETGDVLTSWRSEA